MRPIKPWLEFSKPFRALPGVNVAGADDPSGSTGMGETDKLHKPSENPVTHMRPECDNSRGKEVTSKTKERQMAVSEILNSYGHWLTRTVSANVTLVSPALTALPPQARRPNTGGMRELHDASWNGKYG